MKTLEDVMTRDVEVLTPQALLRRAAELMRQLDADSLPVCEDGKLVGVVTARDLVVRGVAMGHDADRSPVSSVMAPDFESLSPGTSLDDARSRFEELSLDVLPVVDDQRRLLGHVSRSLLMPEVAHPPTARELEEFFGPGSSWH